jgi:hypothetical protein
VTAVRVYTAPEVDAAIAAALAPYALAVNAGLSVVAEKTAAGVDVANTAVPCDTTATSFTRTLPAAPAVGSRVRYVNTATTGQNLLTIAAGTGDTILGGGFTIAATGTQDLYCIKANTWARF